MTNWHGAAAGASIFTETASLVASNCCPCNQALRNGHDGTAESSCIPEHPLALFQCTQLGHAQTACCDCHPAHHIIDTAEVSLSGAVGSPRHAHQACSLPAAVSEELCTGQAETSAALAQPALADDDALLLQEHHASTLVSDQQPALAAVQPGAVQAKPPRSVWSMSASSDSSSSHTTPSCPDVSSGARPMASPESPGTHADGYRRQLPDGASYIDGLSHFHTNISLRRGDNDTNFSAAVTAELMRPAFDPERFIMGCISEDKLNSHRLVDYTVQQVLCGDDTDRSKYGLPICKGSSCPLSTQAGKGWSLEDRACTVEAWAIVLISAVFQPRTGAGQETITLVTFVVHICSSSGGNIIAFAIPFCKSAVRLTCCLHHDGMDCNGCYSIYLNIYGVCNSVAGCHRYWGIIKSRVDGCSQVSATGGKPEVLYQHKVDGAGRSSTSCHCNLGRASGWHVEAEARHPNITTHETCCAEQ